MCITHNMPKRKAKRPTVVNKAKNAEKNLISENGIINEALRRVIDLRKNNVVLQSKLSKLSTGLRNMMAPELATSFKNRRSGMKKPGKNYKHIGSITTTFNNLHDSMYRTGTVVNLRKANLKNFIFKYNNIHKSKTPPLNSRTTWPFDVVKLNGTNANNVNTRLYASRGNHVGAMTFGTTAHNVPENPKVPHLRKEGLVTQIAKYVHTPVFAISTFSRPKHPLSDVFPGKHSKVGNYVKTNLYTRNNFSTRH